MEFVLFLCAAFSVVITLSIVGVLLYESLGFFAQVSVMEFLTDTVWTPLFANPRYGILPLLSGTLLSTVVALCVAGPLGLVAALYLSEFASPNGSSRRYSRPSFPAFPASTFSAPGSSWVS
jgi:phosphate transport system permease protein